MKATSRPNAYTWDETMAAERHGAAHLDVAFGLRYLIVRSTDAHEHQGIDRFVIARDDGTAIYRVDYKVDRKAYRTRCLPLEHEAVVIGERVTKPGWVLTTTADLVAFYVAGGDVVHLIKVRELRCLWPAITATFHKAIRETATREDGLIAYRTRFYRVPIGWLRDHAGIWRSCTVTTDQLRLAFQRQQGVTLPPP